ncbi:MipA/OmpV family protein [uncultured Psychrobacter sp.]|uniref:MipA/OmpV family protein n=1 Tax=uncultured Psychrobacter sp. TaxID=259303 RepID=UPI0025919495|nr:MipA/OmpV family protein [uncultured Psychrobacter sp.]
MKITAKKLLNTATVTLSSGMLTLGSNMAQAQTIAPEMATDSTDKLGVQLGVNVRINNTAYDIDDGDVSVLPSLFFDNDKYYARGSQIGTYLVDDGSNEVLAFVQPGGSSFDPDDAKGDLANLDERKWSGLVGASYMRTTPIGGFRAQVSTDVLGRSDGTIARLTYLGKLTPGKWTIYPSAGLEWVNSNYNEYYYGISQKEADKTNLEVYKPDSSISPYISINATYNINKDWDLFLGQSVNFLADEQRDSPMVKDRVDYTTTVGLLYEF